MIIINNMIYQLLNLPSSPGTISSGIETELAQLRQEIATERLERQHLARLVDSLVKDGDTVARCDWGLGGLG